MKKFRQHFKNHPITDAIILYAVYTALFFLTEQLNTRPAILLHSAIDDMIPFSRYAVVFYCLWFPEIAAVILYVYFKRSRDEFFRAVFLPLMLMMCSLAIYFIIPTQLNLRPETVDGNDVFAWATRVIYSVDDSRNVCPSIHVAVCYLMADIWIRNTDRKTGVLMTVLNVLISLSTLFLKQHSIIDVAVGVVYAVLFRYLFDRWLRKIAGEDAQ